MCYNGSNRIPIGVPYPHLYRPSQLTDVFPSLLHRYYNRSFDRIPWISECWLPTLHNLIITSVASPIACGPHSLWSSAQSTVLVGILAVRYPYPTYPIVAPEDLVTSSQSIDCYPLGTMISYNSRVSGSLN